MPANASPRNPVITLVAYFGATLAIGALLAPPLFWAGQAGAAQIAGLTGTAPFGYLHKVMVESEFTRYFNRALLVSALVCMVPFVRRLGLRKADFALGHNPFRWRDLATGFLLGAGLLLLLGVVMEWAGVYSWKDDPRWGKSLARAATTGFGVAVLEEFFFRGALFALLLRSFRRTPALWILSVIFAALHFLKPPDSVNVARDEVSWESGFWLVGQIFATFGNPIFLLAEFATLLAVGLVLGMARLRTGSLWLPIGLHAGWVFGVFLFRGIASGSKATRAGDYLPWIGENLRTGLAPLAAVALTAGLLALYTRSRRGGPPQPPEP